MRADPSSSLEGPVGYNAGMKSMPPIAALVARAGELEVPPSLVIKSELGRAVLRALAPLGGLYLQGGGALHHAYGSPRFSADLDLAQTEGFSETAFTEALEQARQAAARSWGECSLEPCAGRGPLRRDKLRLSLRPTTSLVLAIERYRTAVHRPERHPLRQEAPNPPTIPVEALAEIAADKVVASLDRHRTRGSLKLTDVYDLDLILAREAPDRALVLAKLRDYGLPLDLSELAPVARQLDDLAVFELEQRLQNVLPAQARTPHDARRAVRRVRQLFEELARW